MLDAVGAGELPDAAQYGDEGSDTLGNVARAVGGLDLPSLEALGLGNVEPLEGCPPQPGAQAVAGRLLRAVEGQGHDDRPLGAHGDRHRAGVPDLSARVPARRDRPVHAPHRPRRARATRRPRGRRSSRSWGRSTSGPGKWIVYTSADSVFQIAAHEDTIPLEELYDGCRAAREILTGKHAVGRVIARPFTGEPGNYVRTPNRHDFSLEPRRPNYLTLMREAGQKVYGVGKIGDIFAGQDIDESQPTKSNIEGIQADGEAPPRDRRRLRLRQPRRDGHALGTPERSGQLPPLPAGLRLPASRSARRAPRRAISSSSRRTTAATRRRRRRTTPASTPSCSPTSRDETQPARSTRASSRTSARR